ncbi:MAG: DUF3800 domain-containing protein [bacterium]
MFNYIQSKFGTWPDGKTAKNIPTTRILDDPFFKESGSSYFIQIADFFAYGLLPNKHPKHSVRQVGLSQCLPELKAPLTIPEIFGKTGNGVITDE